MGRHGGKMTTGFHSTYPVHPAYRCRNLDFGSDYVCPLRRPVAAPDLP